MKKKDREKSDADHIIFFIIVLFFFLVPFFISYFFTYEYIERKSPVTAQDEANGFTKIISNEDLNNLYKGRNKNIEEVPILGYHQIREINNQDTEKEKLFITSPKVFEEEMKYLKDNNYTSISITEYINFLKDKIKNPIPKKSIIITFDDGYISQYQNAFSILKKYNMTATFFIYADCIDKYPVCMTSHNLKDLTNNNMKLSNHTFHHAYLTDYKDNTIKNEIEKNQDFLESFGEENIEKVLAYPYGVTDERVKNIVKDLKYLGGVGVSFYAKDENDIFNLPRYLLGDKIDNFYNLLK